MRRIAKLVCTVCIIGSMLLATTITSFAHPQASDHNKELEAVLFEDGYSKYQSDEIKQYIQDMEYASYLTIDQFGGNGENQYNTLKKDKMGGLPFRFSSIDYHEDLLGSGKQINANTHRMYTHQGWDRDYSSKGKDPQKFWTARRKILLGTVNSVFDFNAITLFGYDEKCNSLAGIIYYVHILGDYDEADNYKKIVLLPDIAGRDTANDDDKDYDMITSLKSYIEILFEDQKTSSDYKELMKELDNIAKDAGKIVQSTGGVNSDVEFEDYHQYANDILDVLIEYMPKLLKNEEFFNKVFYPDN